MSKQMRKCVLGGILLQLLFLVGCSKEEKGESAPTFTVQEATDITRTTAKLGGEVLTDNMQNFECGFLYATVSTVPTKDAIKARGTSVNTYRYEVTLKDLKPNTVYYYCMYVSNGANMVRSTEIKKFTTMEDGVPLLDDVTILSVVEHSLEVQSRIIDEGGSDVRQYGFAYKAETDKNFINVYATEFEDADTKTFRLTIDKLEPETSYIIKAIASNAKGEGESNKEAKQATKSLESPTLTTLDVTNITATSCVVTGELENPGKGIVFERGFMISEKGSSDVPKVIKTNVPLSEKAFMETIGELKPNTTYLVYAYAKSTFQTQTLMGQGGTKPFVTLERKVPQLSGVACKSVDAASNSMIVSANIDSLGNGSIRKCGFYYSTTNTNPSASDQQLECVLGENNSMVGTIAGLLKNKTYHIRAYAFNEEGVGLGKVNDLIPFPVNPLSLGNVGYSMTGNKMTLTSKVTSTGGGVVSERGFMWSTKHDVISEMETVVATGDDNLFTITLPDIKKDTRYYVRAYAINENGTSYGESRDFIPIEVSAPTLGELKTTVNQKSVLLESSVANANNGTTTARGFLWSTTINDPAKMENSLEATGNDGKFTAEMKEITPNQQYFICAYATNEKGKSYGSITALTPWELTLPTVDKVNHSLTGTTLTLTSKVISNGNGSVSERGFRWSEITSDPAAMKRLKATTGTDAEFSAELTGIKVNQMYYVCAYAINGSGESFGVVESITPIKLGKPTVGATKWEMEGKNLVLSSAATGEGEFIKAGFYYSTSGTPNTGSSFLSATPGEQFTATLKELNVNTVYYVCAYAENAAGGTLGSVVTIDRPLKSPYLGDMYINGCTGTSITVRFSIWEAYGTISAKGFCYSLTNKTPTLADGHVECSGTDLSATITGLERGKTYYICAYATNENGTTYSTVVSQKTKTVPGAGDIESPDKNN